MKIEIVRNRLYLRERENNLPDKCTFGTRQELKEVCKFYEVVENGGHTVSNALSSAYNAGYGEIIFECKNNTEELPDTREGWRDIKANDKYNFVRVVKNPAPTKADYEKMEADHIVELARANDYITDLQLQLKSQEARFRDFKIGRIKSFRQCHAAMSEDQMIVMSKESLGFLLDNITTDKWQETVIYPKMTLKELREESNGS